MSEQRAQDMSSIDREARDTFFRFGGVQLWVDFLERIPTKLGASRQAAAALPMAALQNQSAKNGWWVYLGVG
jgi:hypothetical protein